MFCAICKKKVKSGNGPFFKVPNDERKRRIWIESCRMQFPEKALICSDHFSPSSFIRSKSRCMLMPCAVPNVSPLQEEQIEFNVNIIPNNEGQISSNLANNSVPCLLADDPLKLKTKYNFTVSPENTGIIYKEQQTQTDPDIFGYGTYAEKVRKLDSENRELRFQLMQANMAINAMRKIFTEGQIRRLMSPGLTKWQPNDISSAISLYTVGSKAYKYLYDKGFPLPHVHTLQSWRYKAKKKEKKITTSIVKSEKAKEIDMDDFSGDDNDWFKDFCEEESNNNNSIATNTSLTSNNNLNHGPSWKNYLKSKKISTSKSRNKRTIHKARNNKKPMEHNNWLESIPKNVTVYIAQRPMEHRKLEETNSLKTAGSKLDVNRTIPSKNVIGKAPVKRKKLEGKNSSTSGEISFESSDSNKLLNRVNSSENFLDAKDIKARNVKKPVEHHKWLDSIPKNVTVYVAKKPVEHRNLEETNSLKSVDNKLELSDVNRTIPLKNVAGKSPVKYKKLEENNPSLNAERNYESSFLKEYLNRINSAENFLDAKKFKARKTPVEDNKWPETIPKNVTVYIAKKPLEPRKLEETNSSRTDESKLELLNLNRTKSTKHINGRSPVKHKELEEKDSLANGESLFESSDLNEFLNSINSCDNFLDEF